MFAQLYLTLKSAVEGPGPVQLTLDDLDEAEHQQVERDRRAWQACEVVGAENLCHHAVFMNHATGAVAAPEAEVVQVGDAIWQRVSAAITEFGNPAS